MRVQCVESNMYTSGVVVGEVYSAEDNGNSVRVRVDETSVLVLPKMIFNNLFIVL